MKKISYRIGCCSIFALLLFNHSGCIDKSFIEIEPQTDSTVIAANTTIAELKALYTGNLLQLDETTFSGRDSIFIEGIVTSDDRSGNFYKSIVIQDTTGGIEVRIDKTYLYNDFRRGQRVVVVCNNLYIGDNGGLIQIGSTYTLNGDRLLGGVDGDVLINKHLLRKGHAIVPVAPLIFEPSTLTISNLSRLIAVDEAEFLEIT